MDVLVPFAAALALAAPRGRARAPPSGAAGARAPRLGGVARGLRSRRRRALAWGAAAGWDDRAFRVYYLFGGLLTAALLGAGSLLRAGRPLGSARRARLRRARGRRRARRADRPGRHRRLDPRCRRRTSTFFPARALALVGNVAGTVAAVGVALDGHPAAPGRERADHRRRRRRGGRQRARRARRRAAGRSSPPSRRRCSTAGFVSRRLTSVAHLGDAARAVEPAAALAEPDPAEERRRARRGWHPRPRAPRRSRDGRSAAGEHPQAADRVEHHQRRASRTASGARRAGPGRSSRRGRARPRAPRRAPRRARRPGRTTSCSARSPSGRARRAAVPNRFHPAPERVGEERDRELALDDEEREVVGDACRRTRSARATGRSRSTSERGAFTVQRASAHAAS